MIDSLIQRLNLIATSLNTSALDEIILELSNRKEPKHACYWDASDREVGFDDIEDLLEHEGEREVNGIGIESDSDALENAKKNARAILTGEKNG